MSEAPIRPTVLKTQIKIDFLCSVVFKKKKEKRTSMSTLDSR